MANEFKIKKGLIVDGDSTFSGSLESTQAVTASFFTGSFYGDGTNLTGITAEWDGSHNGDAEITGSLTISGSSAELTVGGKVSINGTEDELLTLNVTDDGPVYMSFERSNNRHGYIGFGSSGDNFSITNEEVGHITISTGGGEKIRIEAGGNVGIGQPSPTAKLNVKGSGATSATTALLIENSAGTDLLKVTDDGVVTSSGNLSLGGASNVETLSISGNIYFDATSTISADGSLNLTGGTANIAVNSPTGDITITGGVTGSSFTGSFVGDGSGLTGISGGGGTPGGSTTEVQFNDGGAFGGNSNFVFDDTNTRLAIGSTSLDNTLTVGGDLRVGTSLIETYTATNLSTGANVIAALSYVSNARIAMFVDYGVFDAVSGATRAGRVMIASNGVNITSTDNSTADIGGSTTGVIWSAVINTGNSTIDITLTVPATGTWGTSIHITSF